MKEGFTYFLSNKNRTVLYIGATTNLKERVELRFDVNKEGVASN